jgi:methylenetetrahydrofolate dehydrogenase (NADP+)/methenyltetrahydrofolate cyclohydrolase
VTCLLDGRSLAARLEARLAPRARRFAERYARPPTLVSVLHGGNAAARRQAALKAAAAERAGMLVRVVALAADADSGAARAVLAALSVDDAVDGILLQYPLPAAVDELAAAAALPQAKDLDVSGPAAVARFERGGPAPAAPAAMMALFRHHWIHAAARPTLVIGHGTPHDHPFAVRLARAGARVERCTPADATLIERMAGAELVVAAVGAPGIVQARHLRRGAVVVDAGYFNAGGSGDIDFTDAPPLHALIPAPGGIGPVTVAVLLARTLRAAERRAR